MSNLTEVLSEAQKLAPSERLDLVDQLLNGLDSLDVATDALWAREVEDRLAAYRQGEISAVPLSVALEKYLPK